MQRLFAGLSLVAALAFAVSPGYACSFHDVSASAGHEEVVAMSTAKDTARPVVIDNTKCQAGDSNCQSAQK